MSDQKEPGKNSSDTLEPFQRTLNPEEFDDIEDPMLGKTIAERYRIISLLGRGGMSSVYKAEHVTLKRMMALKVLHAHLASDQNSLKRFQQEAWIAGAFSHPNVVQVYDFGMEPDGQVYLVMDLVEGKSLAEELGVVCRISYQRAIDIFLQVAGAIEASHNAGVLHRDIKPSNIMLTVGVDNVERARIVDFGIAKILDIDGDSIQRLTQTGEVFGSPLYMSPEQCQGKALDKRSDIYALGCVLYESLTGNPPHLGKNAMETMKKHISEIPKTFSEQVPHANIPGRMEEIVFRMLEKNPANRYKDLAEFQADLQAFKSLPDKGTTVPGKMAKIKREFARRKKLLQMIASGALAVLALSAFAVRYAYPEYLKYQWDSEYKSARTLFDQGNYKEAEKAATEALSWAEKSRDSAGKESKTLELLAKIYKRLGNYLAMQDAHQRQQRLIQGELTQKYGVTNSEIERLAANTLAEAPAQVKREEDPETYEQVIYRLNAAAALCNQHNHSEFAEKLIKKAIELRESTSGKSAASLPAMYNLLASSCVQQKKFVDAEKYFSKQLEIARVCSGKEKAGLILAECNMVRVYTAKGEIDKGEALAKEALAMAEKDCGDKDHLVKTCLEDYAALLRAAGRDAEAIPLEKRAGAINAK